MKTHMSFGTRDLKKSVAFYRTLLNAEPAKHFEEYALFVTEEPGLELALNFNPNVQIVEAAHYGVGVESASEVDAAMARLEAGGVAVDVEREEDCCYANQTKVWASDPDGRRWEVYTVHEELEESRACC